MNIPFLNLRAQYDLIKDEFSSKLEQVLQRSAFAGGPFVEEFEKDFAAFSGCKHAIGVGNGTEALWMALIGLGIGQGDEVITTPNTFIATTEAISFCGASPVFVDVDERTGNMDPAMLPRAITGRTKAIIPVHLHGQTADMAPIMDIATRHNLYVIEDACQAHDAEYKTKKAGTMGAAGCFSFYPGKNLGAFGEAGAVTTDDDRLAAAIRMFRDHGQAKKYHHSIIGWNCRMDGIQGAVLAVKLKHLRTWTEGRRKNAALYTSLLRNLDELALPVEADFARHVYHIYAIRTERRDALLNFLQGRGIGCGIHYPVPIHLQEAYRHMGHKSGDFPIAEKLAATTLSLPMFPELTEEQITYVADAIHKFFRNH
ncbi:MAG: DegT/DnrJ/EryC1/StrS family aminotransferase [Bacteroidales bacterium]|jgi:dTDP-4-amino-4,6-dideoxygalactose transaminase|nr:DegT/DnrJ/EryC1/StrS family aminotransferase [Bacteroidales bacterium]